MKFLVLYEELAAYFINCLNYLANTENAEILIFCKKINPVAPFHFNNIHKNIRMLEREAFNENSLSEQIIQFNPDFTYLAGWMYKPYLKIIKKQKLKNVIIGLDNAWTGSLRQIIGAAYFQSFHKKYIKAAFVAGKQQALFAEKLGFRKEFISENLYCCDNELYTHFYETYKKNQIQIPKRFLFVGRYVPEKGIELLWNAFINLHKEIPNEWELWCVGKGPLQAPNHPKIKHLGFIQPNMMGEIIENTGVFVLPSLFEPWGVALHEFTLSGYPVICSNRVGASSKFVSDELNGFTIKAGSYNELLNALKKIVTLSNGAIAQMGKESHRLGKTVDTLVWKQCLLKLAYGSNT